jgi:hypothetical protein
VFVILKRSVGWLALLAVLEVCVQVAMGQPPRSAGIPPPKTLPGFMETAMALAESKGDRLEITLRFTADPKTPALKEVKLFGRDVRITNLDGKPIVKPAERMSKFTPVFLTTSPAPIDPFWLLNAKRPTLIVAVDPRKLFGPPPPAPGAGRRADLEPSTANADLDTALAKVDGKVGTLVVTLQLAHLVPMVRREKRKVFSDVLREVNGKKVIVKEPREEMVTVRYLVPDGFRAVQLAGRDVKAFDAKGKVVPRSAWPNLFKDFRPALVGSDEKSATDPYWSSNSKPNTTIFVVDAAKLAPTAARADGRTVWKHSLGSFVKVGADRWEERDKDGKATFQFKELSRTAEYVHLYDAMRQLGVKLYNTEASIKYDTKESKWGGLYAGKWDK